MLPNLIALLLSTMAICAINLFLALLGYVSVAPPPQGEFWNKLFSNIGEIPGITIAGISGAFGAFFKCLFEILDKMNQNNINDRSTRDQLTSVVIKPMIGSLSAIVLFLIITSGLLHIGFLFTDDQTKVPAKVQEIIDNPRLGYLFWKMRPRTIPDLCKLILYSFIGGFFYHLGPGFLKEIRKSIFAK